MLFNSLTFLAFLPIVFGVYWFALARSVKAQNVWLLIASYVFYGWWDWRFLGLIAFTSGVSYLTGLKCAQGQSHRKCWLVISLVLNLAILGFFKYCNFFLESTAALLQMFGMKANMPVLQVILPVGISFYTFQALSYTIDVYRDKIKPVHDWVAFFTFVSFFRPHRARVESSAPVHPTPSIRLRCGAAWRVSRRVRALQEDGGCRHVGLVCRPGIRPSGALQLNGVRAGCRVLLIPDLLRLLRVFGLCAWVGASFRF